MRGIYVHVPFCERKCAYCDFYSVPLSAAREEAGGFAGLVVRELGLLLSAHPGLRDVPSDTVFFGGGTPTVLGAGALRGLIAAIRDRLPVAPGAEVSVEANPGTVGPEALRDLRAGGFNRLSLGVQSFSPRILSTLGRSHGPGDAVRAFRAAREAGFDNVGLDLIFGIPGQSRAQWREDLERAVALGPSHVSAYALSPERGTPLHAAVARGGLSLPPDEEIAAMYGDLREILASSGFRQYEISNFSRPGAECRHNLKYWRREGYLGLGPAAHGLLFPPGRSPYGLRTANPPSFGEYGRRIREGRLPWADAREADRDDAWREGLIAGLRMTEGVDLAEAEKRWGAPPDTVRGALDRLGGAGRLVRDGSRVRLPAELLFVSNAVLEEFA